MEKEAVSEFQTQSHPFTSQMIGWMLQVPTSRLTSAFREVFPDLRLAQGKQYFFTINQVVQVARSIFKYPRVESMSQDLANTASLIQHLSLTIQEMTRTLNNAVAVDRKMGQDADMDEEETPVEVEPTKEDLLQAVAKASLIINEPKARIWMDVYNYLMINFNVNPHTLAEQEAQDGDMEILPIDIIERKGLIRESLNYVEEYTA